MSKERVIIDNVEKLEAEIARLREAQKVFATYSQEQVDKIFLAAALAANKERIPLAKMAVEETGMGVVEDKVIKNHYASEYIYNAYKDTKTCGDIEEEKEFGIKKIAEPIGVIAAVIPTTNPTSTAIFKTLIALKTRNAIIISPHPRAKKSTIAAAKVVLDPAVAAGAPEGIINWIDVPSLDMTNLVMKEADIILATGGPGMVKAAYSKTVNWDKRKEIILYVYNPDEEFRKIEPDIKERIFSGFNISIRKMQCINTIPNYIIND